MTEIHRTGAPPGYKACTHCLHYVLFTDLHVCVHGKRYAICRECAEGKVCWC